MATKISLPAAKRVRFPAHSPLRGELKRRVDAYFEESGKDRRGGLAMCLKSLTFLGWAVASYLLLLLWASSWWTAVPLAVSLGLAVAGIGFSVMHDGGHGSYSKRPWLNGLSAKIVDLVGGSSFYWRQKHNVLHHTYTNVKDADEDIDAGSLLRLSPHQPRRWWHRFQHGYELLLLCFFASKWMFYDDLAGWIRGKNGTRDITRPRGWELAWFLGAKLFFFTWAVMIPLLLHPFLSVLLAFFVASAVAGVTLGVVFQLAHVVEGTAYEPAPAGKPLQRPFAEHQLATTANFAPRNRLVSWYVGGLNYQVEHHLFPKISHLHYPALAKIVRETCEEYGLRYLSFPTLRSAVASHFRLLKQLGRNDRLAVVGHQLPQKRSLKRVA